MSKQGKRKKNLLKKFENIDNETLSKYLYNEIYKYFVLKKSTELAKEILSKNNIETYRTFNDYKFNRYEILLELATLRNISIPSIDEVEVSNIDIIFRIKEYQLAETGWYEEFNYMFDSTNNECIREESIPDTDKYYSYEIIEEITKKYDKIILKEFGIETLNLYEEKRKEYLSMNLETMFKEVMPIDAIPKILLREKR